MAPEQALGESVDGRSDLYALGVTAYFALSGRLPFTGADATEVLAKQVTEPAPGLAETGAAVPRKVAHIVQRCLCKDRDERPASAADVADQLTVALERRKELPLALRAFVKHDSRLDGPGALMYPVTVFIGTGLVASFFGLRASFWFLLGAFTVGPLAVLVYRARRVLRSGFDHGDLAHAFKSEIEQGREERAFGAGHGPSVLERVIRSIALAGFAGMFAGFGVGVGSLIALGGITAVGGTSVALIMLQRRRDVDTEFYARLWNGPIGRWLFRIARWITPRDAMPAAFTHRPTELAIGLAADQLFGKLDKDTRKRLGDLPGAVRGLERDAQRMRARLDVLNDALGGAAQHAATDARGERDRVLVELQKERDLVQKRLGDAVAALETIRLGLLRLHAGTTTVQSLTTDLGLARQVAKDVNQLLDGRREVERLLATTTDPEGA
jgi:serine/threonine-protein kinase